MKLRFFSVDNSAFWHSFAPFRQNPTFDQEEKPEKLLRKNKVRISAVRIFNLEAVAKRKNPRLKFAFRIDQNSIHKRAHLKTLFFEWMGF